MENRKLAYIVKNQDPLILSPESGVREACRLMWEKCVGSVLVARDGRELVGIFTGRDAVRVLAGEPSSSGRTLGDVMTADPVTISPDSRAIDALRLMSDHGFRHLPVVEQGRIWGIVSRGDFKAAELDRIEQDQHLWETIR